MSYATSVVKLIQRGTINHSTSGSTVTATITSLDTAKSLCTLLGTRSEESANNKLWATVYLTNATTVSVQTASAPDSSNARTNFEVVEYY